jgi:hypothetical protein
MFRDRFTEENDGQFREKGVLKAFLFTDSVSELRGQMLYKILMLQTELYPCAGLLYTVLITFHRVLLASIKRCCCADILNSEIMNLLDMR